MKPVNVVEHLPPAKQWELSLEAVTRVKASGMEGVQVGRALKIIASGQCLLTWRRADGKYHFCDVPPVTLRKQ